MSQDRREEHKYITLGKTNMITNMNYEEMTDSNDDDYQTEPPISYKLMEDTVIIYADKYHPKPNTEKKRVDKNLDTI